MIKFKKLSLLTVAAIMAGLLFNSCANDNEKGGGKDGGNFDTAYFSLRMSGASATNGTRATELGVDDEQKVDGVYVLLYDASGNLKYGWNLAVTNIENGTNNLVAFYDKATGNIGGDGAAPTTGSFVSVGKEVLAEPYNLVVIANPGGYTATFVEAANGTIDAGASTLGVYASTTTLETAVTGISEADFGANPSGNMFFMSNANGLIPVPVNKLKDTQKAAEQAPVNVKIDRLLAKVLVLEPQNGPLVVDAPESTSNIGTVSNFTWGIKNVNTKTFLVRKMTNLSEEIGGAMEVEGSDRQYIYAEDPNMLASITGDFQSGASGLAWNAYGASEDIYAYVTENTFNEAAQVHTSALKGYATYLDISANIALTALGAVNGYYSYQEGTSWRTFSWDQAKAWMAAPGTLPHNMANLLTYIADLPASAAGTVFDFATSTDPTVTTGDIVNITTETTSRVIYYHPNGLNRYSLPIEHFAYDSSDYGYYGVVRNNVYKITINKIVGPGNTAADTGWLAASIEVNPWFIREQGAIITPERP